MIKKIYVGLNDNYHDPSICIIDDHGNILFAEGIERYLQYKRGHGCPADLDIYIEGIFKNLKIHEIEEVRISSSWNWIYHIYVKFLNVILNRKIINYLFPKTYASYALSRKSAGLTQNGAGIDFFIANNNLKSNVVEFKFSHHLTHIINAINSQHSNNKSIGIVIDGGAELENISIYSINEKVKRVKRINSNVSFGDIYDIFTAIAGFSTLKGEEWKLMGLSAYGTIIQEDFDFLKKSIGTLKKQNKKKLIKQNIINLINQKNYSQTQIASLGQALFEDYFFQLIHWAKELLPDHDTIYICGGSALNSLAIGKLHESGLFKKVIVPNAPGDDGNSIGAGVLAYQKDNPNFVLTQKEGEVRSPYLGNEIKEKVLENYIQKSGLPFKKLENSSKYAAELLHQNKIIGWIQGRAEFGPRALGNRSILANPCFAENKDRINAVVKFRESFRPFAPSILHEYGEAYFSKYDFTPYMEKTLTFREEVRTKVPAVVHVDGTGRLQSVTTEINPKFHALISEFNALSGVPIVVNTSYNVMGKPIVNDINDVMAVFFNSQLDAVIIHDYVLERPFHFV